MEKRIKTYKSIGEFYDDVTTLSLEKTTIRFIGSFSVCLPLHTLEMSETYCFEPFFFRCKDPSKVYLTLTTNGLSKDHPFDEQYVIKWRRGPKRTRLSSFNFPIKKDSWITFHNPRQHCQSVRGSITASKFVLDLMPKLSENFK